MYVRVYDPKTNEPFDVPEAKATELRLQHGWLSHAFEEVKADVVADAQKVEAEAVKIETAAVADAKVAIDDLKNYINANAPTPKP